MQVFISYAHEDYIAFNELWTYLRSLERAFRLSLWADKRINAGDYWNKTIAAAIEDSDIHLLLMSPAFFASDYIFEKELPAICDRSQRGALVIPVLVRRCFWHPFIGVIQAVPMTPKGQLLPISEWKPKGNGYDATAHQIAQSIRTQFGLAATSPFEWDPS